MTQLDVDRWKDKAYELPPERAQAPTSPVAQTIIEAFTAAEFLRNRWEPREEGGIKQPGLRSAASEVPIGTADEVESLARAARYLHTQGAFEFDDRAETRAAVARALAVVDELADVCSFVLDDGVEEPADQTLATIKARQTADDTRATLVQTLFDYAALAESVRERLSRLEGFNLGQIEESRALGDTLSRAGQPRTGKNASDSIELRNRMLVLMQQRVGEIRRSARWVFRQYPSIYRQVTSAYERQRRLQRLRRASTVTDAPTEG